MKTNLNTIAAFLAAAIWADGVYDLTEKDIVDQVAEVYNLQSEELHAAVNTWIDKLESMSEDEVNEELSILGVDVPEDEKGILFECVLEIVLADSKLTHSEVATLLAVADLLCVEQADAVLLLADMIKEAEDIEVAY